MITSMKLLRSLSKLRVEQIAGDYEIDSAYLSKKDLITRVSLSLAKRADDDGNALGKVGAAQRICEAMTRAEAIAFIRGELFPGAEHVYQYTSALYSISADKVRDLLSMLVAAEGVEDHDRICGGRKWGPYFEPFAYEVSEDEAADDDDESEDEDSDDGGDTEEDEELEFEEEPAWLNSLSFDAGPERELPDGLMRTSGSLFDHQRRSVEKLSDWWRDANREKGVLCLPTGAGKTRTAVHFALEHVLSGGGRVLWLAHRHELVNQAVAAFLQNGHVAATNFRIARFEAGPRKFEEPSEVVVASIPTLARSGNVEKLLEINDSFALIVVDECHHAVAQSWNRLLKDLRDRMDGEKLLGLSATPTRTAEGEVKRLWKLFGDIIHEERLLPLMERGILARPRVESVATGETFQASGDERRMFEKFRDLPPSLVKKIASDEARNALIVDRLVKDVQKWGQTLVFAATIEHADDLVDLIREAGLEAEKLDCGSPRDERLAIIERFRARTLPILVNVGLFTEGTDLPGVQTVFLARPTMSRILFQQMVGRGLRGPALGGTADCNVVAFYDNVVGLVQDQLTSSFRTEREILDALTGEEPNEPETEESPDDDDAEGGEEATDDDSSRVRIQELKTALRSLLSGKGEVDQSSLPLVGWWQAGAPDAVRVLPVFESYIEICGGFVAKVLHEAHAGKIIDGITVDESIAPEELVRNFVEAVQFAPKSAQYLSVVGAARADLKRLEGALELERAARRAEPPILGRARWLNSPDRAEKVLVAIDGEPIDLSRRDYEAIGALWQQMGLMMLGANPDAQAINRFITGVLSAKERFPEVAGVRQDLAESLIRAAAGNGGVMPPPTSDNLAATIPPLADIRTELGSIPADQRPHALREYHQAFFKAQQPEYADFLASLLCT